jgi:hypothetical protein
MIRTVFEHLSSSEIISCKECGQHFDTIDPLREMRNQSSRIKNFRRKDFGVTDVKELL